MAAQGHEANAPTAGEYIIHHLQHLQSGKQTGVVDFSVFNMDSVFWAVSLGILTCWLLWLAARKATSGVPGRFQAAVEILVEMVDAQAKGIVHSAESRKFVAPLALTVFVWIFLMNAMDLLGGEQSGHIAGVGFDLYVRLVGEAVASFRGESDETPTEIKIELPVDAHLPHDYVPHERLRLEMYKKLAAVVDAAELAEIEAELVDRYGTPPQAVVNLLEVARLRTVARAAGIADISVQGNHVRFGPVELRESQELRLMRLHPGSIIKPALGTILVPKPMTARVGGRPVRDREVLSWAGEVISSVVMDNVAQAAAVAASRV